jgi:hypothetical protein
VASVIIYILLMYLDGVNHRILIQCNHKNLEYFQTSKVRARIQAGRAEPVSLCDIVTNHLPGNRNEPHGPSRRPDYEIVD